MREGGTEGNLELALHATKHAPTIFKADKECGGRCPSAGRQPMEQKDFAARMFRLRPTVGTGADARERESLKE